MSLIYILFCRPVHGLIFLFKWQPGEEPVGSVVQDSRLDTIFFAKQVINNACATQAIVSVLLNCTHQDVHLGETLSEFKEFSQSFDAAVSTILLFLKYPVCDGSYFNRLLSKLISDERFGAE